MRVSDPHSERLADLSQVAYRLGLAFGAEAERAQETARKLEYFHLFDRCFFAVRVATALQLRLRQAVSLRREVAAESPSDRSDRDPPDREPLDREPADRDRYDERDRDRERDAEPASLPLLLKTLNGVAADASAMPGPKPAALPSLRELLAEVTTGVEPAATGPQASGGGGLRARLRGSTAGAVALRPPVAAGSILRTSGPPGPSARPRPSG